MGLCTLCTYIFEAKLRSAYCVHVCSCSYLGKVIIKDRHRHPQCLWGERGLCGWNIWAVDVLVYFRHKSTLHAMFRSAQLWIMGIWSRRISRPLTDSIHGDHLRAARRADGTESNSITCFTGIPMMLSFDFQALHRVHTLNVRLIRSDSGKCVGVAIHGVDNATRTWLTWMIQAQLLAWTL